MIDHMQGSCDLPMGRACSPSGPHPYRAGGKSGESAVGEATGTHSPLDIPLQGQLFVLALSYHVSQHHLLV